MGYEGEQEKRSNVGGEDGEGKWEEENKEEEKVKEKNNNEEKN